MGIVGGVLVGLLVAAIIGYQVATWDKIAPGVVALSTNLGGLKQEQAVARLGPSLDTILARPLQIRGADRTWDTTPLDLGLRLDPRDLTAEAFAVGREGNPLQRLAEQVSVLLLGENIAVRSQTDQAALDSSLTRIARDIDRAPVDAKLVLSKEGSVQYTQAQSGRSVDVPGTRNKVTEALATGVASVDLLVRETQPAIPNEVVQPAREQLDRMLAGNDAPLTLTFADKSWPLARPEVIKLLSVQGGTKASEPASVKIDDAPLKALAQTLATDLLQEKRDARFTFNGGDLKVLLPSKDGRSLDQAATVALIKSSLLEGKRTAVLPVAVDKAAVSSDDPKALGITELIDRGSTSFAGGIPEKQHNIRLAAERLNGVVVPPGGTFSFNKEVGPTTLDAGFQWGLGITSGESGIQTIPSVAGGICQVATTLFQPVFWSGYQLEERFWHLYWIPSYTSRGVVGLDVTVDADSKLDFKWVNPTDDYVLIQSATDEGNVYFGLYGKKPAWKVEVDPAKIDNRVPADPKPMAQAEPSMPWGRTLAVETAREGFDAVITRRVTLNSGGEPRVLSLKSSYVPSRTMTLVGTAGMPADTKIEDVLDRVASGGKPQENKPAPTPTPAAASTPAPVATAGAGATPATAATKPAAPAATQPAAATQAPARTATPSAAQPTPKPSGSGASAPVNPTTVATR